VVIWQHNVYYVCVTFSVVSYVGFENSLTLTRHRRTPWWWSIKIMSECS